MKSLRHMGIYFLLISFFLIAGCGSGDGGGGITSKGSGTGSFVLNSSGTELTFDITVDGLSGPITAAHFHNAATGLDGPFVRTITSSFSSTASGVWKNIDSEPLTTSLVTELEAGRIYVNIHTSAKSDGEIRGQLNPASSGSEGFTARLEGDDEVPPVITGGTGTGVFILNAAKNELSYDITVNELSGPVMSAHFHNAPEGVSASSFVRTIIFSNNHASGVWKGTDSEPLTTALVTELEAGRIYVNVHTSSHPGGEIRGQVVVNIGTTFAASLTSGAETGTGGGSGGGNGY